MKEVSAHGSNDAADAQRASQSAVLNGGWEVFFILTNILSHTPALCFLILACRLVGRQIKGKETQPGRADRRELLAAFMARLIIMYDSYFLFQTHHVDLFITLLSCIIPASVTIIAK